MEKVGYELGEAGKQIRESLDSKLLLSFNLLLFCKELHNKAYNYNLDIKVRLSKNNIELYLKRQKKNFELNERIEEAKIK